MTDSTMGLGAIMAKIQATDTHDPDHFKLVRRRDEFPPKSKVGIIHRVELWVAPIQPLKSQFELKALAEAAFGGHAVVFRGMGMLSLYEKIGTSTTTYEITDPGVASELGGPEPVTHDLLRAIHITLYSSEATARSYAGSDHRFRVRTSHASNEHATFTEGRDRARGMPVR